MKASGLSFSGPCRRSSTALICTTASLPPSSGSMKPKPFVALNHLTVPGSHVTSPRCAEKRAVPPRDLRAGLIRFQAVLGEESRFGAIDGTETIVGMTPFPLFSQKKQAKSRFSCSDARSAIPQCADALGGPPRYPPCRLENFPKVFFLLRGLRFSDDSIVRAKVFVFGSPCAPLGHHPHQEEARDRQSNVGDDLSRCSTVGLRRVTPHACVADGKRHLRAFLTDVSKISAS